MIDAFDIKLDEGRFRTYVQSLALPYVDENTFFKWFFSDQGRVESARVQVMEEQAIDKIFELAQTKEKAIRYDELEKVLSKELADYE